MAAELFCVHEYVLTEAPEGAVPPQMLLAAGFKLQAVRALDPLEIFVV